MGIGKNIKEYLIDHGISQKYISIKTGIDQWKVTAIVNEKVNLSVVDYIKICNVLSVSLYEFVPDEYQPDKYVTSFRIKG